jgi:hypothetical protein
MTEWRIEFGEQIGAGAVSEKCSTQHGKEEGG